MPIAGAAQGAAQALEKIVAERLLAERLQQEIARQEQQASLEQQRINEMIRSNDINAGQRQQQIDLQAGDRRERQNVKGVRRMLQDAIVQRQGPINSEDRRGLAALQIEAGDNPTLLNEPKVERDPIADYEERKKIDRKYERPQTGPQPDYEWVMRGGNPVQIRKGTAQPGDAPYDPVAQRKQPDSAGPSPYAAERAQRTIQSVDELMGKVSRWTAGVGSLLSGVPETDARNFSTELDTLKANIAFNELAQMREASKTGGALGAVSEREMALLQSTLGGLDAGQSPENLKAQLKKVKESVQRWQAAQGAGGAVPIDTPAPNAGVGLADLVYDPRTKRFIKRGGE